MEDEGRELVEKIHREAWEALRKAGPPPACPEPKIHYTELSADKPDSPLYHEWETYRREVGRLLAEGNEHRWVLIKGEQVVGHWNTRDKAILIGYCKFPNQAFLVHQIREREPLLINKYLWRS